MVTIAARGRVSRDGTLDLPVTTGLPETDKSGWPEGFFEATFGSLRDNPIACDAPPRFEVRQELR